MELRAIVFISYSKNPFLRALFHVFMTYFPECHANTKKPHWCVLTEKQSTLKFSIYTIHVRSFVCSHSVSFCLCSSFSTAQQSHTRCSWWSLRSADCVVLCVKFRLSASIAAVDIIFSCASLLSYYFVSIQSIRSCALFWSHMMWTREIFFTLLYAILHCSIIVYGITYTRPTIALRVFATLWCIFDIFMCLIFAITVANAWCLLLILGFVAIFPFVFRDQSQYESTRKTNTIAGTMWAERWTF